MQLAHTLKGQGLDVFPCALVFNAAKSRYEKKPIVPKGVSWADFARQPLDAQRVDWPTVTLLGLPIPGGRRGY